MNDILAEVLGALFEALVPKHVANVLGGVVAFTVSVALVGLGGFLGHEIWLGNADPNVSIAVVVFLSLGAWCLALGIKILRS